VSFWVLFVFLLPAAPPTPIQLYTYLSHCPDDRALRRHTLYPSTICIDIDDKLVSILPETSSKCSMQTLNNSRISPPHPLNNNQIQLLGSFSSLFPSLDPQVLFLAASGFLASKGTTHGCRSIPILVTPSVPTNRP
jgi:hypothetical protein